MDKLFIGIDTSCYTTSVACVSTAAVEADERKYLPVASGARGLRQSDGVFHHTRNLGEMVPPLLAGIDRSAVAAVGVSAAPRCQSGSYMPVFMCGVSFGAAIAAALDVPLYRFSHQQGHIAAASSVLPDKPCIALHLSGGTTELVLADGRLSTSVIGGTGDLSAGQFVDRIGVALGLRFPAGKELESLAVRGYDAIKLPSSVKGLECSFSGAESRLAAQLSAVDACDAAYAVYDCIARTLAKLLLNCAGERPDAGILIVGGVASSRLLRFLVQRRLDGRLVPAWGDDGYCTDNAVGTARLAQAKFSGREVHTLE